MLSALFVVLFGGQRCYLLKGNGTRPSCDSTHGQGAQGFK